MKEIMIGILMLGGIGVVVGVVLAVASRIFYVWVDPKVEAITEALPGANCGGCGLPGCGSNAEAIAAGKSSPSSCVAGGPEVAIEIAGIMGVSVQAKEPDFARPGCYYGVQEADLKYIYNGVADCRASAILNGGSKECPIGCLGLGTCVKSCPFSALSMGPDNLPVVNLSLCTGCGTCERICPKHIITLSSYSRRILHEFTTEECSAPCQKTCPAGVDVPAYINRIVKGQYLDAVRIIKETNPFPLVCGRICVHPCEYVCRRNLVDEPVAINNLKRFVSDYEMMSGVRVHNPRAPETGKRVAIAGGGIEGLTAAYLLNRLGYDTVVYESTSQLGGLLKTGIPQNRLPEEIIEWEIAGILDAGVQVFTNKALGKDISVESLLMEGFSAVFVATGGWDTLFKERALDNTRIRIIPGVQLLIDFILEMDTWKTSYSGKKMAILGGGNTALKAAEISLQGGAEEVSIIIRSSRDSSRLSDNAIINAEEKGVKFYFNCAIAKISGEFDNITDIEVVMLNDNGDETGEKSVIAVDNLLIDAGRFPEIVYIPANNQASSERNGKIKWETILPYPGPFADNDAGLFRPGEETSDYKAVVDAIGAGRRVASSIHRYFIGEPLEAPENMIRKNTYVLTLDKLEPVPRTSRKKMPEAVLEKRINDPDLEVSIGYSEEEAVNEAKRCLKCGLICYRRSESDGEPG